MTTSRTQVYTAATRKLYARVLPFVQEASIILESEDTSDVAEKMLTVVVKSLIGIEESMEEVRNAQAKSTQIYRPRNT